MHIYRYYSPITVATQLCIILLENTPVDDIITVFRSHNLLLDDDLTAVTNAPSDYLKKMFLLRHLQNVSLSVWSTICAVVNESEILKHLYDQLVKGSYRMERNFNKGNVSRFGKSSMIRQTKTIQFSTYN